MIIIRVQARLFEHLIPVIEEHERKGFNYLFSQDDGVVHSMASGYCCKIVAFDDGNKGVEFEDRTTKRVTY